ncbi:MAG TPA: diaminopimelate decarboxylase [Thermomicrobiales bacterium]|nr:diaminopimelate decarboxylase [Thermomicrobiales bacterium]
MAWPDTTRRTAEGSLEFGGVSAVDLAREFGTPLFVFDEATLRARARRIREDFRIAYERSRLVYAGKAYLSPALMQILVEEGIGLDVVSGGEIYAGLRAGVDPAQVIFHGNNKSRAELEEAVATGVGLIAVDNDLEITLLESVARDSGRRVEVVLRLNPGVDVHTHQKMRTGATDSKFGFPVWDGQAEEAATRICRSTQLELVGYHAHVGSQIFDPMLVAETIDVIMEVAGRVQSRFSVIPTVIIPGGGFGIADDASGTDVDIGAWAKAAANAIERGCRSHGFPLPVLVAEPGRAIVGPAGLTLYSVGSQKTVPGIRTYVSVDGGMADNIRPALYGARYTATLANRDPAREPLRTVTIAGKYCESGDVLIDEVLLPELEVGDLLAVPMTGAYCLAMASNYNLALRPAVVIVGDGSARLVRRRETYTDLLRSDIFDFPESSEVDEPRLSAMKGSL